MTRRSFSRMLALGLVCVAAACRNDMYNQPKLKPLAESDFFRDGASARPLPAHVVARETNLLNPAWSTGLTNGVYLTQLPMPLTAQLLQRGRERYDIYC